MLNTYCFNIINNNFYELLNIENGVISRLKKETLIKAMKNKKIEVVNLALNKNSELEIVEMPIQQKYMQDGIDKAKREAKFRNMIERARILGAKSTIITPSYGAKCILISYSNNSHKLYIPDDVILLNLVGSYIASFTIELQKINGSIQVIGGENLRDINRMFYRCTFDSIDLSGMKTQHVENMSSMFSGCNVKSINLKGINTAKVKNMNFMFEWCTTGKVDLTGFSLNDYCTLQGMFDYSSMQIVSNNSIIKQAYENRK